MFKFILFWIASLAYAVMGTLAKLAHGETVMFWVLVVGAVFFWLAAFGARLEDREKDKIKAKARGKLKKKNKPKIDTPDE